MLDIKRRRSISLLLLAGLLVVTGVFYNMQTAAEELEDGVYSASAEGYQSAVHVEVTVTDGRISDIAVTEHDETAQIAEPAFAELIETILSTGSVDVEVVSGATLSSEALLKAVRSALGILPPLEDGTYQGTAAGYQSDIKVEVTIADGTITAVRVLEADETPGIADPALETIPQAIVDAQRTDVDAVSGATVTSEAIKAAAAAALGL